MSVSKSPLPAAISSVTMKESPSLFSSGGQGGLFPFADSGRDSELFETTSKDRPACHPFYPPSASPARTNVFSSARSRATQRPSGKIPALFLRMTFLFPPERIPLQG